MTKWEKKRLQRSNPSGAMEQTWLAYVATLDVDDVGVAALPMPKSRPRVRSMAQTR